MNDNIYLYKKTRHLVDKLYDIFLISAWSYGYYNIAKQGAKSAWERFCAENTRGVVREWIDTLLGSKCTKELRKYFNEKIRTQKPFKPAEGIC